MVEQREAGLLDVSDGDRAKTDVAEVKVQGDAGRLTTSDQHRVGGLEGGESDAAIDPGDGGAQRSIELGHLDILAAARGAMKRVEIVESLCDRDDGAFGRADSPAP